MTDLGTFAPEIAEPPRFLPTGSLTVSLPEVDADDGSVRSLGVLLERPPCLLAAHGDPLARPVLRVDGVEVTPGPLRWTRLGDWLPSFTADAGPGRLTGTYCAPVGERGVVLRLRYRHGGTARADVELGWTGTWARTSVTHLRPKPVAAAAVGADDPWTGSRVVALAAPLPLLAVAWRGGEGVTVTSPTDDAAAPGWLALRRGRTAPGDVVEADVCLGVAGEPDGAATTALHLRRRGVDALLRQTLDWLAAHRLPVAGPPGLAERVNANLFFGYFFAQGDCLDTCRPVVVTSRSPHYYVSAAFWSRDAYCWTFPALLLTDADRARDVLVASLAAAGPRVAEHALYLDGTPLYPGFELDQAAAPVLAVARYVAATGDRTVLAEPAVAAALQRLPAQVAPWRHPDAALYATFLLPTDDPTEHPYVTTCNAMLAAAFDALAVLGRGEDHRRTADAIRAALRERMVVDGPHGPMWAWACDAAGRQEVRDEPPLGLRSLPYWGLADPPVQAATLAWLAEGNPHAYAGRFPGAGAPHFPHPSGFDLANRLLDRDTAGGDPLAQLAETPMDRGLACESWDPDTGEVRTGAAMASMGGLLAWTAWAHLTGHERWDEPLLPPGRRRPTGTGEPRAPHGL